MCVVAFIQSKIASLVAGVNCFFVLSYLDENVPFWVEVNSDGDIKNEWHPGHECPHRRWEAP